MDQESDAIEPELLAAVRQGDELASRHLLNLLYPTVIAIIRNHLPNSETEEDLAQDVFLKIFSRLSQFRGEKPLRHWAGRIAMHTCYDALRRQRNRPVLRFSDLDAHETRLLSRVRSEQVTGEAAGDGEAAGELVARLVAALKPDQQLAVRLLDLELRSVKEAAEITGWSVSKVKVCAMRARQQLAKILRSWEKDVHNPKAPHDHE